MTVLTFATGTIAGGAIVAAFLVPASNEAFDGPARQFESPPCQAIACQFLPSGASLELEQRLERRGYVCTGKARLADSVIVDLEAGAKVVPFDKAMQLGQQGSGWMRSYCSQP